MEEVKRNKMKYIKDFVMMLAGTFLTAAGISLFFTPNKIVSGGVSGISTILFYVADIPVDLSFAIINGLLLLAGIRILGREFILKTILGAGSMTVFINILSKIPPVTDDTMLAALFGGILYGVGLGITFISGASTGGTDILGRMIQWKFPTMGIGKLLLFIDGVVIGVSTLVFRQVDLVLLGIIGLFIQTVTIDALIARMNVSEMAVVVTEQGNTIAKTIVGESPRGVTLINGTGAYTDRDKQVLLCAMKSSETAQFQKRINEIDPNTFVIFLESKFILGNGFRFYK